MSWSELRLRATERFLLMGTLVIAIAAGFLPAARAQQPIFEPVRPGTGNWLTVEGGTFEDRSGSLSVLNTYATPGNWYLFASQGTTGTATATAAAAYRGQRGIQIQPGANNGPGIALTFGRVFNLPGGVPHVLSGWVRRPTNASPQAQVYLDLWGAVGGFKVPTSPRPGWQFIHGTFVPGSSAVGIRLVLDGAVLSTEEVWVDELAITPASAFIPPAPSLGLFNVRFGTKDSEPIVGPAAYGESGTDFWNHYSRDEINGGFRVLGSVAPLLNGVGAVTGAGLSIANAPGAWTTGHPNPLMAVYLYPLGGDPRVTITVTNLPTGAYDLYLYGHGAPSDNLNTAFLVTSGEMTYGIRTTSTDPAWRQRSWVEGMQFVRFPNVFVSSGQLLTVLADSAAGPIPSVNGIQLVRTSEEMFRVWPDSTEYTNSIRISAMSDPKLRVRFAIAADPTTNSPVLSDGLDLTSTVTLRIRAFEGERPASPVFLRTYRRVYVFEASIPAEWRIRYFGADYAFKPEATNDSDPDRDGSTNLEEYQGSTNPLDPLEGFAMAARLIPAVSWVSVPGVTYLILRKDQLTDPQWTEVGRVVADSPRAQYVDSTVTDVPRFYRVQAVR